MAMLLLLRRLPPGRLAPPLTRPRLLLPPPPVNVVPVCAAGGRGHSAAVASTAGVGAISPFSSSGRGRDDGDDGSRRRGRRRPRPTAGLMGFPGIRPGTYYWACVRSFEQNKTDARALLLIAIRFTDCMPVHPSIHSTPKSLIAHGPCILFLYYTHIQATAGAERGQGCQRRRPSRQRTGRGC